MADIALMHHLLIALGIGLLIGAERERRTAERPVSAQLRSFTIVTLVSKRTITPTEAIVPVLISCTTSNLAKMLFSAKAGTGTFAARVIPAQAGIVIASWTVGHLALRIL